MREYVFSIGNSFSRFEPKTALLGGADGLDCYRSISKELQENPGYLSDDGLLFLEIGKGQGDQVRSIFKHLHFKESAKDLEDIERCLVFSKK